MRTCENCGQPLSAARMAAAPEEKWCVACIEAAGDVERIRGVMLWHHKTAPELYTGPGTEKILSEQRKGPHAQMAFTSKNNPIMLKSLETFNVSAELNLRERPQSREELAPVNQPMARCHPDRPRVTPKGHCLECALAYYERRQR